MGQIDVGGSTWIRCSPKVQSGFTCDAHLLCSCVDRGREAEVIRTTVARRKEGGKVERKQMEEEEKMDGGRRGRRRNL